MEAMDKEEIKLLLDLLRHGWETGIVRGEEGSDKMRALRLKLEAMLKSAPVDKK